MVENSLVSSIERIELLRGEEPYKYDFTQKSIDNWKITISPNSHGASSPKFLVSVLYVIAAVYAQSQRELTLLKVQYKKSGFTGMLRDYFKFRLETIRSKFQRGDLL